MNRTRLENPRSLKRVPGMCLMCQEFPPVNGEFCENCARELTEFFEREEELKDSWHEEWRQRAEANEAEWREQQG